MIPEGRREPGDGALGSGVAQLPALEWLLAQPDVIRCFAEWAGRVQARDHVFTLRLGAVALQHGFASGLDLYAADPASLSTIAAADRARVLREYRATIQADGRQLGRACLALAAQVLPRAPVSPCAAAPVAQRLLDAFIEQLQGVSEEGSDGQGKGKRPVEIDPALAEEIHRKLTQLHVDPTNKSQVLEQLNQPPLPAARPPEPSPGKDPFPRRRVPRRPPGPHDRALERCAALHRRAV